MVDVLVWFVERGQVFCEADVETLNTSNDTRSPLSTL
jgi:hypothetical protein